jgi:MFS family permease
MVLGTDRRVLVLAFARMIDSLANSFLIIVLPLYLGAEGPVSTGALVGAEIPLLGFEITTELLIGVVLSLFGFLNSFSQPFTGRVSDRTGRRRAFILFGLGVLGAASAAYAFATAYWEVLVIRALQGIGAAFTIPVTVALVNELSTTTTRGGSFGVFNAFRLIGFGFGPLVAGLVVEAGPYRLASPGSSTATTTTISGFNAAFAVAAIGALVSFLLVTALVSDPEQTKVAAGEDLSVSIRGPDGGLDPVFALAVATVLMALGIALFATLENVIRTRLDEGAFLFSLQFAATVIANVVFQVPIGRWSDRVGRRPFIVWGFVFLVPTTLAQGFVTTPALMTAARFFQGLAVAMVFAPSLALAGDLAGEGRSGTTLSLLTMGFGLGVGFGPLVSGFLVSFGFAVPFVFAAGAGVVGLFLVYTQVEETVDLGGGGATPEPVTDD